MFTSRSGQIIPSLPGPSGDDEYNLLSPKIILLNAIRMIPTIRLIPTVSISCSARPRIRQPEPGGHYPDIIRAQITIIRLHQDQAGGIYNRLTYAYKFKSDHPRRSLVHENVAENLTNSPSKYIFSFGLPYLTACYYF